MIDVSIKGPIAANSLFILSQAAIRDLGIVMLPSLVISDTIKNRQLIPILESFPSRPSGIPINAAFSQHHSTVPNGRALVDFLVERLREHAEIP